MGSRNLDSGTQAVKKLKAENLTQVEAVQIDVSSDESVEAARALIGKRTEALDVLINNAGVDGGIPQNYVRCLLEYMKKIIYALFVALAFSVFAFGQTPKVKIKDLQNLTGAQWKGTLSYLDYRKNTKVSIPSKLTVAQSKDDKSSWIFEYQYPDEPKANSKETVTISEDGKTFDGETVIERTILADKTLKIVTEKSGPDNDKKALFRFTYLLGKTSFSIRKEVRYEGTTEFFVRNEYNWKR